MRPFVVGVADILHKPGARRHERLTAPMAGLAVTGSHAVEGADVTVDVWLESVHEGILATGTVAVGWEGECRRCLRTADGDLAAPFQELFEEVPAEGESYPLRHEQADLEPLARESVLLELPQAPLCQEDCRGLCAQCGADLNEGPCDCEPVRDPRWAALDAIRITETED